VNTKSYLIAAAVAATIVLWMASGYLATDGRAPGTGETGAATAADPVTVQISLREARPVQRRLETQGEARPDRRVVLRAETTGRVEAVLVDKGAAVRSGDPLVRLAMNDRQARLKQAQALVAQREADYRAASQLGDRGYQSESAKRQAFAALEAARADLAASREDIANTELRAPFSGIVEDRMVEVGDYLKVGESVASVVDMDPLRIRVDIAQQDIRRPRLGGGAEVVLATGDKLSGTVSYIAPAASDGTHTFPVEITVPNPGGLPAGVSATVRMPVDMEHAHFLSPAVLALDSDGQLGAKTVDDSGIVRFHPVSILRTERDGVWVTGLPDPARLITRGQGFVRAGERVRAVTAAASGLSADGPAVPAPGAGG